MISKNSQRGIGLIEVLVALLLLAVAVLGFSFMQMNAVKATDESLLRSRALTIMRGGAEMLRTNSGSDAVKAFKDTLNATTNPTDADLAKCLDNTGCSPVDMATRDANALKKRALENEMKIRMVGCPGTNETIQCMVTSWGETNASLGTGAKDCAKEDGSYNPGATCFMMEAY